MSKLSAGDADPDRRVLRLACLITAGLLAATGTVNALTILTDAAREGQTLDPRVPWILEYSSTTMLAALVPLIFLLAQRFPLTTGRWRHDIAAHAIGSLLFSALHVGGMILLRKAVFWFLLARGYQFFEEPLSDLAYEYRKDALTYALILLLVTLLRLIEEQKGQVRSVDSRLKLKSGGRTIWLEPQSLHWAQAAANYVDIRANGSMHLVRISLSALERQLAAAGVDVVRVHRSRIVNRATIIEVVPLRDGDFYVRTSDGVELKGSRRYRHLLGDS